MDKYDLKTKEYKEIINLKDFKIPINKDQHVEKAEQWPIWKLAIENALASARKKSIVAKLLRDPSTHPHLLQELQDYLRYILAPPYLHPSSD
jgi:hypothetical protein